MEIERHRVIASQVTIDAAINSYNGIEIMMFSVSVHNGSTTTPVQGLGGIVEDFGPIDYLEALAPGVRHTKMIQLGLGLARSAMPLPPPEEREAWRQQMVQRTTISFDLHGRRWERRGNAPPEPVNDE